MTSRDIGDGGKSSPSLADGEYVMTQYAVRGVPNGVSYTGVVSEYPSDDVVSDMVWECVPDDTPEEPEVALTVSQYAALVAKAKAYDTMLAVCVHAPRCVCE
jgi:hypothetical protein